MSSGLYIGGRPSFSLKGIFSKKDHLKRFFPLNHERSYYFFSARYALAAGIKALGISSGDKVLLPSYNCGVEIDPFKHFGIETGFYRIDRSLRVDLDDLLQRIDGRVKAILITYFLGFPQPINEIKRICTEKGLFLIEDCAHAFLSDANGKALGSYGDISIFSLLKTLSVPNGGVLVINNQDITYRHDAENPNFFSTIYYAAELLKNRTYFNSDSYGEKTARILSYGLYYSLSMGGVFLAGFRKYLHPSGPYLVRPDSYIFNENICSWGMSAMSQTILRQTDFERVKDIRRKNFQYLLEYFLEHERGDLPFRELPQGVCPLFFPIVLNSSETREKIYTTLKSRGVITHPWWDRFHPHVPWDDFPEAVYLKQRLFGLPIHQDLTLKELDFVIVNFEEAYRNIRNLS
jgi:dTDP-4-amino-4,6-dideoxygalactose transaminase